MPEHSSSTRNAKMRETQKVLKELIVTMNNNSTDTIEKLTLSQNSNDYGPAAIKACMNVTQEAYQLWFELEALMKML